MIINAKLSEYFTCNYLLVENWISITFCRKVFEFQHVPINIRYLNVLPLS